MTRRQAPPLEAVEAFMAACAAPSFRSAADQLALSPSAFSRRIQTLEHFLGMSLFDRSGARPVLTAIGRNYHAAVAPPITAIRRATASARGDDRDDALRLMAPQSLAVSWLVPRLAQYLQDNPDDAIVLDAGRRLQALTDGSADLAIIAVPRDLGALPSDPLIDLEGCAMAAPVMNDGRPPPTELADLAGHQLLEPYLPARAWERWLDAVGYTGDFARPQQFSTALLSYETAAAGLGIILGVPFLADTFVEQGRLRRCIDRAAPLGVGYSLVYANERTRRRPVVRRFNDWLQSEFDASVRRFTA